MTAAVHGQHQGLEGQAAEEAPRRRAGRLQHGDVPLALQRGHVDDRADHAGGRQPQEAVDHREGLGALAERAGQVLGHLRVGHEGEAGRQRARTPSHDDGAGQRLAGEERLLHVLDGQEHGGLAEVEGGARRRADDRERAPEDGDVLTGSQPEGGVDQRLARAVRQPAGAHLGRLGDAAALVADEVDVDVLDRGPAHEQRARRGHARDGRDRARCRRRQQLRSGERPAGAVGHHPAVGAEQVDDPRTLAAHVGDGALEQQREREGERRGDDGDDEASTPPLQVAQADQPHAGQHAPPLPRLTGVMSDGRGGAGTTSPDRGYDLAPRRRRRFNLAGGA